MIEENIKSEVIGVDISIESTTYAIVDVRGNIIARDYLNTQDYATATEYVSALSEKVVTMAETGMPAANAVARLLQKLSQAK